MVTKDIRCIADIFKATACTACDNTLIDVHSAVMDFIFQRKFNRTVQADLCTLLYIIENIHEIRIQFLDCVCIARMEWHRNHRSDLTKVDLHNAVIVSHRTRIQLLVVLGPPMNLIKFPDRIVRSPD